MLEDENLFSLFETNKESKIATKEILSLIKNFEEDLGNMCEKWRKCGARDTASREAIAIYIAKNVLRLKLPF